jgi:uncharacterized membrane protein
MIVVVITVLATFLLQTGYLLWKISADSLPKIGKDKPVTVIRGFLSNPKWVIGYFATFIGWILLVKAMDLGEISLVQPLVSVGDVFLVTMAVVFLKEKLRTYEWLGLFLIMLGAISLATDVRESIVTVLNWSHIFIFVGVLITLWGALMLFKKWGRLEIILALVTGVSFGLGGVLTKVMTLYLVVNNQALESWYFIFNPIFPFMVLANVTGLIMLQMAFQNGRASVVVPVQLAVLNGISVLAGMLLFLESISMFRLFCVLLIITGTAVLQWVGSNKEHSIVYSV